jgi:DNA-binding transcriptional LysR family regulator
MELGELKVFVAVATERSFSRAAVKLCRTQPAISQAVRRLEDDLGERLFDRSSKLAALTPAGDALLPEAKRLLRLADDAADAVRRHSQRERAVLRIGCDEPDAHALLPALTAFLADHPHVSVEFRRIADVDMVGEVGAGNVDIGVTTANRVSGPVACLPVPVTADGFCVLLPKSHHLAAWRELPLSVMNEGRILTLAGTTTLPGSVASGDGGGAAPLGSFIVMPGIDSLKHAVAEGLGIAIVPRAVVNGRAGAGLVAVPLSATGGGCTLTVVYRKGEGRTAAADEFIETLRSAGGRSRPRQASISMRASG